MFRTNDLFSAGWSTHKSFLAAPYPRISLNTFLTAYEERFTFALGPAIKLRYLLDPQVSHINADESQLVSLMDIFLSNGKKAMPDGGQLILQTSEAAQLPPDGPFRQTQAPSYLKVSISDTGCGIPDEIQDRLHRLMSGHWRPKGAFFAGLARAKEILDAHHAELLLYSQLARGTTFKIYFPLEKAFRAHTVAPGSKGTENILFVEDDAVIRRLYTTYLRQRGYQILEAQHGREAFEVYERYPGSIDLMITDIVMPDLNGRQLADLVAVKHPELKVLYISGFTKDAIVQRGILTAETPYLEKPFGREELALRVRQILDAH